MRELNDTSSASWSRGGRIGNHVKIMDGYRHCAVPDPERGSNPAIGDT